MKVLNMVLVAGLCVSAVVQVSAAKIDINPLGEMTILPIENLCEISVSTPNIDYGARTSGQLEWVDGQKRTLGKRTLTLNVVCPFSQVMHIQLRGSRSHDGQLQFGDSSRITLKVFDAELDGKPTQLTLIKDGIHKKTATDSLYLRPDFGMIVTPNGDVVKGKVFTARLEVEPVLNEKDARVTYRKVVEADFTLELIK